MSEQVASAGDRRDTPEVDHDEEVLLARVVAVQRRINQLAAVQLTWVAALAERRVAAAAAEPAEGPPGRCDGVELAAAELGAALGRGRRAAADLVELALILRRFPAVATALTAGDIDVVKARLVASAVAPLRDGDAVAVVEELLPRAGRLTAAGVAAAARRAVLQHDTRPPAEARARARAGRRTWIEHGADGLSRFVAHGPTEQVLRIGAAVDAMARAGAAAEHDAAKPSLDQRRFDATVALADAVLDNPRLPGTAAGAPGLVLRGGVKALARLTGDGEPAEHAQPEEDAQPADEPVELAGYGPIPDWLARELLTHRHTRVMVLDRRLRLDCRPVPGYQVPAWMAGAVLAVHAHCAFPGCAIPAHRCDLDHVLAHPRGPTCVCNLVPLCRWHHRLKTHGGWRLRLLAGRIAQWTSPIGRRYLVHPDGETEADVGEAAGVGGPRSCAAEPRRPRGQNGGRRFATVPE